MRVIASAAVLVATVSCGNTSGVEPAKRLPPLILQLEAPARGAAGAPTRVSATLRNTSNLPAQVTLGGRPPFDVVARTSHGAKVWQWSDGHAVQMILEMKTLGPGEQMTFDAEWPARDAGGRTRAPGRYVMHAVLNMDPPETIESAPLEIELVSN